MHALPIADKWVQRALYVVAAIGLLFGCRMAYAFGREMSFDHGVFLVLVAILAALVLPVRDVVAAYGWKGTAKTITYCLAPVLIAGEFFSHLGYTFGQRDGNVSKAIHQTVALKEQGESLAEAKQRLQAAEARIKQLAWLPSGVTANGLRDDIRNLEGDAIYRRSKECANVTLPESRKFCDRLTDIRKQLAAREDLTKEEQRREAAQRVLDGQRDKVATIAKTENGHSAVVAQTQAFAKLWTMSLDPDAGSQDGVKYAIGVFIALLATMVPPTALTLACRMGRRPEDEMATHEPAKPAAAVVEITSPQPQARPLTVNTATIADLRHRLTSVRGTLAA